MHTSWLSESCAPVAVQHKECGGLSNTEHNLNNIFLSETSVRVFPSQSRGSLNEDLQDIIYLQLMHQKLFRNSFEGCLQTLKLKANKDCKY